MYLFIYLFIYLPVYVKGLFCDSNQFQLILEMVFLRPCQMCLFLFRYKYTIFLHLLIFRRVRIIAESDC